MSGQDFVAWLLGWRQPRPEHGTPGGAQRLTHHGRSNRKLPAGSAAPPGAHSPPPHLCKHPGLIQHKVLHLTRAWRSKGHTCQGRAATARWGRRRHTRTDTRPLPVTAGVGARPPAAVCRPRPHLRRALRHAPQECVGLPDGGHDVRPDLPLHVGAQAWGAGAAGQGASQGGWVNRRRGRLVHACRQGLAGQGAFHTRRCAPMARNVRADQHTVSHILYAGLDMEPRTLRCAALCSGGAAGPTCQLQCCQLLHGAGPLLGNLQAGQEHTFVAGCNRHSRRAALEQGWAHAAAGRRCLQHTQAGPGVAQPRAAQGGLPTRVSLQPVPGSPCPAQRC